MSPRKFLVSILVLGFALTGPAVAQYVYVDWTSNTTFETGMITATAATSNPVNVSQLPLTGIAAQDGATNYPDAWYTLTPEVGVEWSTGGINNAADGSIGSIDVTVTFSEAVQNPRFHFLNLDNGSIDFAATPTTLLSGNPIFDVAGSVVNAVTQAATVGGCQDAMGAGSNGACGSVELSGSFTSVTFTIIDNNTSTGGGDGFAWTMSLDPTPPPPVTEVPTASELALLLLALLLGTTAVWRLRR